MLDLNDLLIFTQVVESGSFTAAAEVLGSPKSTVSRRVSSLEAQLGTRLLQRTTRKLNLTDAGRTLHARSAHIMSDLRDAESAVTKMRAEPVGRLRITAPVEFPAIARLATDFLSLHPKVQIDLDLTNRYVDLVEEGFDVAVRAGVLSDSTMVATKLREARRVLVASPAYLDSNGTPQSVEELANHDCVIFGPWSPKAGWTLYGPNGLMKVPIKGRLSVNHLDAARHAAAAGFGIAILPVDWIAGDIAAGRLKTILPEAGGPPRPLWAITPSRKHVSPAVRAFVDFLKTQLA